MSVLVVAAHPDDEVLGAGGTIASLARAGETVHIAILGEGLTSRYEDRAGVPQDELETLRRDANRAAEILGVAELVIHQLPDNRFDTVAMLDVVKMVEDIVRRIDPHTIYTHHPGDLNVDHGVVYRAVLTATRPGTGPAVERIYAFEVPSSTDWAFGGLSSFRPTSFRDIAETLELKVAAMEAYESEARPFRIPARRRR